jgi:hypothetical protein
MHCYKEYTVSIQTARKTAILVREHEEISHGCKFSGVTLEDGNRFFKKRLALRLVGNWLHFNSLCGVASTISKANIHKLIQP